MSGSKTPRFAMVCIHLFSLTSIIPVQGVAHRLHPPPCRLIRLSQPSQARPPIDRMGRRTRGRTFLGRVRSLRAMVRGRSPIRDLEDVRIPMIGPHRNAFIGTNEANDSPIPPKPIVSSPIRDEPRFAQKSPFRPKPSPIVLGSPLNLGRRSQDVPNRFRPMAVSIRSITPVKLSPAQTRLRTRPKRRPAQKPCLPRVRDARWAPTRP